MLNNDYRDILLALSNRKADGLKFEDAFANSQTIEIEGIPVHVL